VYIFFNSLVLTPGKFLEKYFIRPLKSPYTILEIELIPLYDFSNSRVCPFSSLKGKDSPLLLKVSIN